MTADIELAERAEVPTAAVRRTVPMDELTDFFSHAFAETMRVLTTQGIQPSGPPFGKYYGMPGATVDVEAGFPVPEPVTGSGEVEPGTLPGGRIVEAVHVGPYDTMTQTYAAIEEFIAARGWAPSEVMWESCLSDPGIEPDPGAWRTLVSWPVRSEDARAATG